MKKKGDNKAPKNEQAFVFIIRKCYTHVNAKTAKIVTCVWPNT